MVLLVSNPEINKHKQKPSGIQNSKSIAPE